MKDNINLQQNTSSICKPCESCGQFGHTFNGCPMIKFHSNKHRQIFNYNQLTQPLRQPKTRRDVTFTTLQCANQVSESVLGFHDHMFYMQQIKEESERKQFKNYCTIDDDDDYYESDPEQQQNMNNEDIQSNKVDQQDKESRKKVVTLNGKEEQSFSDDQGKNNNKNISFNALNLQHLNNHGLKKQNQSRKSISKRSSIFARELSMRSQDNSEEESETEEQHQKYQDQNSTKKQTQFNKENNTQLSTFFQFSVKDIEKGEQKVDKLNLELIVEEENKENLMTEQVQQDGIKEKSGSQDNIGNTFKSKFFPKKTDDLRRKSRYISASQLQKQLSIQLSDVNSPEKHIFSPNTPNMKTGEFIYPVKTSTMTPREFRRATLRNGPQLKQFLENLMEKMKEQAEEKENLAKKYSQPLVFEIEQDFDVMRDYEIYFIHNNPTAVIEKSNQIIKNNAVSQQLRKEKSLKRKKKAGATTKIKYEKKNFNLLQKKPTPSQKNQQHNAHLNNMPVDWIKQQDMEKSPELGKLESDALIIDEIQFSNAQK